ncbi:LRR and NB-ARC domain disease resistance protein, partial [Trifolium medium]|nr:LRR and NB-ARC domain disease resistance protein [Trifolium medium]
VSVLLEKLVSTEFVDNFRSIKLDDSLLEKLKTTLTRVLIALNDDDDDDDDVVNDKLRYAVFEVKDLVNEINTEALRCKVEYEDQILSSSASQVLLDRLDSTALVHNFRSKMLDVSLLKDLKTALLYLDYAIARKILTIGHWVDMLRYAIFEIVYLFDEIKPKRCKVEGKLKTLSPPFIWFKFNGFQKSLE